MIYFYFDFSYLQFYIRWRRDAIRAGARASLHLEMVCRRYQYIDVIGPTMTGARMLRVQCQDIKIVQSSRRERGERGRERVTCRKRMGKYKKKMAY